MFHPAMSAGARLEEDHAADELVPQPGDPVQSATKLFAAKDKAKDEEPKRRVSAEVPS